MWLTERDWQIIRLVHRHRFLRSDQIITLIGDSRQQILRRLKLLFHHGYLERPRAQIVRRANNGGTNKIIYGLGSNGGRMLRQQFGLTVYAHSWSERNHVVGRIYLDHALFVADVLVAIELACRKRGNVRLFYEDELPLYAERQPFRWQVQIGGGPTLGIVPDRLFALEYTDAAGAMQRAYFFLEADRGTMPVKRNTLSQTSFHRKMLAYASTWNQGIHEREFGINRFRVITVTTSAKRVQNLVQTCSELRRGRGLFLFADHSILAGDVLARIWQTGRPGEIGGLLD
jgi:hypothetical protein